MSKKVKAYNQIKVLQSRQAAEAAAKAEERAAAARILDGKKMRVSKRAVERTAAAKRMAKSLENYPKNPGVWEANKTDGGRKGDGQLSAKGRANARKAGRAGKQSAARELRKAERIEARAQARAQKKAERAARAAERKEARKLASAAAVKWDAGMVDNVLDVVKNQFSMTDKQIAKQRAVVEGLFGLPPRKIRNRTKRFEIKTALLLQVKMEVEAVLKQQVDKAGEKAATSELKKNAVKATANQVKAVREAAAGGISTAEAFDDAEAPAKKAKNRNARMAEMGAKLALQRVTVVEDVPAVKGNSKAVTEALKKRDIRPAPKATAGKPLTKKSK